MKLTKKCTALLCAAVIALTAAIPVSALNTAPRPASLRIDAAQVDVVNVIDRDLHVAYNITGATGRSAIIGALNTLEYRPYTNVLQPDYDGLRLLQIRMKNGTKYEYWCHRNVLMMENQQLTDGLACADLYKAMSTYYQYYPATIEWLGYMNPYRITDMTIENSKGSTYYQSALSASNRDAILKVSDQLKAVKVSSVIQLNDPTQSPTSYSKGNLQYIIDMAFETAVEQYTIYVYDNSTIAITVGSIPYSLIYTIPEKAIFDTLVNTLKVYDR